MINGYKTYFVALSSIVAVLARLYLHQTTPDTAIEQIVGLVLACTIRHCISTIPAKATEPNTSTTTVPVDEDDGIHVELR